MEWGCRSHATLERRHVGVYLHREHTRDDAGLVGDQLQVACRPGRRARGVDPGQPRDDSLELGVLRQAFSEGDARIVAGETELDAQERALAGDRRPPAQRPTLSLVGPSTSLKRCPAIPRAAPWSNRSARRWRT
jgi:hypothetical protein